MKLIDSRVCISSQDEYVQTHIYVCVCVCECVCVCNACLYVCLRMFFSNSYSNSMAAFEDQV